MSATTVNARIDRESPVPFYYQLQEILKREIENGSWVAGSLLPSEAELAHTFGISRTVIRKALDVLESDGQVRRMKGKGTMVAPPKFRYEAVAAARHWMSHDLTRAAVLWKLIHISRVRAGGYLSRLLEIGAAADVWEIVFVSAVTEQPVSLSQMYLRTDASPALEELAYGEQLPRIIERAPDVLDQLCRSYGFSIETSDITIESTMANEFEATELAIGENVPMFLLSTLFKTCDGPVAFSRTVVRSDHFRFSVVVQEAPTPEADRTGGPT